MIHSRARSCRITDDAQGEVYSFYAADQRLINSYLDKTGSKGDVVPVRK